MATLKGQTIAASYQDLVKRADTYSQTGTNIELMDDSGDVQATGLYLESGATTDFVGIGTATPDSALEVNGSVKFTNGADNSGSVSYDPTAEGGAGVLYAYNLDLISGGRLRSPVNADLTLQQHGSAANIIFNIGGANEKMRIDSAGSVGIGDTDPSEAKLSITGVLAGDDAIKIDNDQDTKSILIDSEATSSNIIHYLAPATTTAWGIMMDDMDSLTTGGGMKIKSNSSSTSTRNLVEIVNDNVLATGATALAIQQDSTGAAIDAGAGYMVNEQGRQDHVANTMPAPYYRFDGTDDYISGTSNQETFPFYLETLFKFDNYTDGGTAVGIVDASSGSRYFNIRGHSTGNIEIWRRNTDDRSLIALAGATPDTWYHVLAYFEDATTLKVYVNGVLLVDTDSATSAAIDSTFDTFTVGVQRLTSPTGYMKGEVAMFRIGNHEPTAAEVKELYSGASVPFKYKGANQTNVIAGWDFTSGWTATGLGNGNAADDNNSFTSASDSQWFRKNFTGWLTTGKRYRLRVAGTISAGDLNIRDHAVNNDIITGLSGTFDESLEFTAGETTNPTREDDGFTFHAADSGSTVDITALEYIPIGAVAEYDGSGVGASRWDDKSGNELHGIITAGATAPTVENAPADADSGLTYEEGTWTPVFAGGSSAGSYTMSNTVARYTKIGRVVHVSCSAFDVTEASAGSGAINITGLPFTVESTAHSRANVGTLELDNFTFTGSLSCTASTGNTYVEFRASATGANDVVLQVGARDGDNSDFSFNITYTV